METQVFKFVLSQAYGNNPGLVNMLYIDDDPGPQDLLDINIQILKSQVDIIAKPQLNKSASDSNYHWELQFDNGAIDPDKIEKITIVNNREWKIAAKQHENTEGDPEAVTSIYFLYIGEKEQSFTAGSNSVLTLDHMGAMSAGGTRVENVSLNWNPNRDYVEFEKNPSGSQEFGGQGSYRKSESNQIDIIHGSNPSRLPLSVGFSSSNIVLNDGSTDNTNTLTLRVVNTSETPIELSSDSSDESKLVISFDGSDETDDAWALATESQIQSIELPSTISHVNNTGTGEWTVNKSSSNSKTIWTILPSGKTQIGSGETYEIKMSNIATGHATGRSNLHFKYENFPGYGDGEFEVAIEKAPLLYSGSQGSGKVGIGVNPGTPRLDVAGTGDTDGKISLQLRSGNSATKYKSNQITFAYNGANTYRHAIKSRHDGGGTSPNNALDFYLWGGNDTADDIGSLKMMSLTGEGVKISGQVSSVNTGDPQLDVAGTGNTDGQISLQLRSGNSGTTYDSNQITFAWNGGNQYRHAIKSRHYNSTSTSADNALDFYLWDGKNDQADDIGSLQMMSLTGEGVKISGKVGIGVSIGDPQLDVAGTGNTDGQISLQLRSGNSGTIYDSNQITFAWNGGNQYRHAIKSRHYNSTSTSADNALDFYLWDGKNDHVDDIGSLKMMSLTGDGLQIGGNAIVDGKVGIGVTEADLSQDDNDYEKLHVAGDIVVGNPQPNQRFLIYGGTNMNGDFLEITHDKSDGSWYWGNGIILKRTGNVGIGTESPSTKLDVSGTVKSENLQIGNTTIGETELSVLYRLAHSQLICGIVNAHTGNIIDNVGFHHNKIGSIQFRHDYNDPNLEDSTRMRLMLG